MRPNDEPKVPFGIGTQTLKQGRKFSDIRRGTTPYGFRRGADGRLVPIPSERATLAYIVELRREGCPFAVIAQHLNDESIPTKRGKRWYASTVAYLVKKVVSRYGQGRTDA